uniref:Secreted protein n=1 Tax=Romanomermis culicivorax TaxID=13658 RepID=A0A915HG90_ROMCU
MFCRVSCLFPYGVWGTFCYSTPAITDELGSHLTTLAKWLCWRSETYPSKSRHPRIKVGDRRRLPLRIFIFHFRIGMSMGRALEK